MSSANRRTLENEKKLSIELMKRMNKIGQDILLGGLQRELRIWQEQHRKLSQITFLDLDRTGAKRVKDYQHQVVLAQK